MTEKKSRFSVAFREQARPIFAYWMLLLFSFLIFGVAVITEDGGLRDKDFFILMGLYLNASVGCALGQSAALLRFRETIGVFHGIIVLFVGGLLLSMQLPEFLEVGIGMYMVLGNIMFFAGLWSIQAGRAMFACWPPLLFSVGSVLVIINHNADTLSTWHSGAKWMVWDISSLLGFVVSMILLIVYLVIRENLRIFRWRNGPRTTIASEEILEKEEQPRISAKGWTSLLVMSVLLSLAVAFLSPYLWQSAPSERGEESTEVGGEEDMKEVDCSNYSGCSPPPECREHEERTKSPPKQGSQEQSEQVLENVTSFLWLLLLILFLSLLAYWVFGRPLRRIFYVRHYRDPLWPISTTKKIENQWDLIRIALADIGVHGGRSESALSLVERSIPAVQEITGSHRRVPGLIAAAKIRDRVVFGLGVAPEDAEKMNENANWVYDSIWDRLGNRHQIKALYRRKLW